MIKIGIDFDNTIVCYDEIFYISALEKKMIPKNFEKSKSNIRNYLRRKGLENKWRQLQGYVYGKMISEAEYYEGFDQFIDQALIKNIKISIVSHKTLYPSTGYKYNLHEAAKKWLLKQVFFNSKIEFFFEQTLEGKLGKIKKLKCDYFIDDLPEVLLETLFPKQTGKILFDPQNIYHESFDYLKFNSWKEICRFVL